ncbi:MAG: enoyl-CoA hydratase/isomerase family protein [Myxococcota bacterium]
MGFENILYETDGAIATVTLNRPKVLNALNHQTVLELQRAVDTFSKDDDLRVMILTGSGEKAFVAGADIAEMSALDAKTAERFARVGQQLSTSMESTPKAIIAAVNGFALGGGCELAMACDFILASDNARFGQPEVNLGLLPGFGGTQRLPRLVGRGMARQLTYTGEIIKAERAREIGLVNAVYPQAELMAAALKIAHTIASKGPLAVGASKRAINRGSDQSMEAGLDYEASLFGAMFTTQDMREGTSAFLEKRAAEFKGN